eukprot:g3079.t1
MEKNLIKPVSTISCASCKKRNWPPPSGGVFLCNFCRAEIVVPTSSSSLSIKKEKVTFPDETPRDQTRKEQWKKNQIRDASLQGPGGSGGSSFFGSLRGVGNRLLRTFSSVDSGEEESIESDEKWFEHVLSEGLISVLKAESIDFDTESSSDEFLKEVNDFVETSIMVDDRRKNGSIVQDSELERMAIAAATEVESNSSKNVKKLPSFDTHITWIRTQSHAPKIFSKIRKHFNVKREDLQSSLSHLITSQSKCSQHSNTGGGRSGARFFHSKDGRFLLKSISATEQTTLRALLRDYTSHLQNSVSDTFLPHFLGLFRFALKPPNAISGNSKVRQVVSKGRSKHWASSGKLFSFLLMRNVFYNSISLGTKISVKYDLKGSTENRFVRVTKASDVEDNSNVEMSEDYDFKNLVTLKDMNMVNAGFKMKLNAKRREEFLAQVNADTILLLKHNLMDYSLLLGVSCVTTQHDEQINGNKNEKEKLFNHIPSAPLNWRDLSYKNISGTAVGEEEYYEHYFVGIIDCLQQWNYSKFGEKMAKTIILASTRRGEKISSIQPRAYQSRFINFMKKTLVPQSEFPIQCGSSKNYEFLMNCLAHQKEIREFLKKLYEEKQNK